MLSLDSKKGCSTFALQPHCCKLFYKLHFGVRIVFAAGLSAVLAVNLNDISSIVDVAVEEGRTYCIGINRYAHFLKRCYALSVKAAGSDNLNVVEAFGIQRTANVANQLLANTVGLKVPI